MMEPQETVGGKDGAGQELLSQTVENYLKQILLEQQRLSSAMGHASLVPMGRLAHAMGVAPGTATAMVKSLAESRLVKYAPRGGVQLTPRGHQLAMRVLRRHRLVELFLVEVLGLDWSEVHPEAEELEHAISDKVLDRIDKLLNHPRVDPHGDPIPSPQGQLASRELKSLSECEVGIPMRVARILDQKQVFLQFLERHQLIPGARVMVSDRELLSDSVRIRTSSQEVTLGNAAAIKIEVERIEGE